MAGDDAGKDEQAAPVSTVLPAAPAHTGNGGVTTSGGMLQGSGDAKSLVAHMPEHVVRVESPTEPPAKIPVTETSDPGKVSVIGPSWVLFWVLLQLVVLLGLFLAWEASWISHDTFPAVYHDVMPIAVPWFGALGGVTNALYSLTQHWSKWDSPDPMVRANERVTWNGWALLQGPIGLMFGTVSVLIVVLVTGTITAGTDGGLDLSTTGIGLLCAVAFAVGFRQDTFQTLIKRTVDILTGPTTKSADKVSFVVEPGELKFETTPQRPSEQKFVTVTNLGSALLVLSSANVRLTQTSPAFKVDLPGNLASGERGVIAVTFDPGSATAPPAAAGAVEAEPVWRAQLTLSLADVERQVQLSGTIAKAVPADGAEGVEVPAVPGDGGGGSGQPGDAGVVVKDPANTEGIQGAQAEVVPGAQGAVTGTPGTGDTVRQPVKREELATGDTPGNNTDKQTTADTAGRTETTAKTGGEDGQHGDEHAEDDADATDDEPRSGPDDPR